MSDPTLMGPSVVKEMLNSSNPLTRYGTAIVIIFGPLYLLSSIGFRWPIVVAVIIITYILMREIGVNKATFQ